MTGLSDGESGLDRRQVPQLTEHHDVGVLTQDMFKCRSKRKGIRADLPLVDHTGFMAMGELYWILERHDMTLKFLVDFID